MKSKKSGFTLIELVTVIAIVGILSAVAIPKYINLSSKANLAAIHSMGGAVLSAAHMVHAKAITEGVQGIQKTTININGSENVEIRYGYPSASRTNGLSKIMGGNFSRDWTWSTSYGDRTFWLTTSKLGGRSGVYVNNTAVRASGCYILYDQAANPGTTPTISYVEDDC